MTPPGEHTELRERTSPSAGRASDLYGAVFRAAPDGILLVDGEGRIREVNDQALGIFGYDRDDLEGRSVDDLVPRPVRDSHRAQREAYGANPHARPMGIEMELTGIRKDGTRVPVEISLSPLDSPDGLLVIAIVRDLTERRRLKDFGAGALRAAEEERRRIARELHDETAQDLAALLLRLKLLERGLERDAAAELTEVREALHATVEGVRRIARGLRPPELEDVGLGAALRSHVRERYPGDLVEMSFDGSEELLGAERGLAAYRIAQEALANAARHSGADTVRLTARRTEHADAVEIEIIDDGRGFDPGQARDLDAGLGLMGMEERAQLAGGAFELTTRPGEGTRIRVRLPLDVPAPGAQPVEEEA